jgi:hypothetical protein
MATSALAEMTVANALVHHRRMKKIHYVILALALAIPGVALASHYFRSGHCPSCPSCPNE